ncbi:dimethyl sulfoxide reductase anchor subunit [Orbaceae bacterium ESL0727]|nr:dimethyl sulfoxide reductase anchor subunit [Orbaceae bacterium ESL0727]
MHELPLVFFTIFGQLAAGMVFIAGLCYLLNNQPNRVMVFERINVVALVIMALGMFIASFHLGKPLRAMNVIFGIGRSPMSNEIFTFGVLFGITFATVLLAYFNKPGKGNKLAFLKKLCQQVNKIPQLPKLLSIVLMIVSLFFVWTIVVTYMLPTVKTWDTYFTALQMYTAMLVLGGIACATLGLRRVGTLFFFIGIVLILGFKIPYLDLMTALSPELAYAQYTWMIVECVLLVLATLLVIINSFLARKLTFIYALAFILVLAGELCGRIVFYNFWTIPL